MVERPSMTRHPQTGEVWDVKGSGAEHRSEERDAETQNTSDGGQTTTASSPLMRQCCHQETVVDEMVFVRPSFLNLVILALARGNS